eukprot:TRINITY_DN3003_c0_g1_i2.p1 TRINITY_DN3003_c0_g1~~TRINITY_DN3003_c0_g1_i2.p1  ORF type:complete len:595 (+),score=104.74 TRINITY_DN3003_c0_g1_i2:90-1874(+)
MPGPERGSPHWASLMLPCCEAQSIISPGDSPGRYPSQQTPGVGVEFKMVATSEGLTSGCMLSCGDGVTATLTDFKGQKWRASGAGDPLFKDAQEEQEQAIIGRISSRTLFAEANVPLPREHTRNTETSPRSEAGNQISSNYPFASRKSSESVNVSQLFSAGSGEWWLLTQERDGGAHSHANSGEAELAEGWLGKPPPRLIGKRTTRFESGMFGWVRQKAADGRHRYNFHGFDLDLAYVTTRVIAMGFPSQGAGMSFRNPRSEVARFLQWAHGDDFRIYNLCAEKSHTNNGFPDETVPFPCADHCPPDLATMFNFCRDAESWLTRNSSSIAAIHCKAGKGRSGTMVCALLLYAGALPTAREALRWFAKVRGGTRAGVTIPSQIRWVAMFENWLHDRVQLASDPMSPMTARYQLRSLRLGPLRDDFCCQSSPGGRQAAGGTRTLFIHVGLASRSATGMVEGVHRYKKKLVTLDEEGYAELELPETGPVWTKHDGMLSIVLQKPGWSAPCLGRPSAVSKLKMSAWWHHSFLQRPAAQGLQGMLDTAWAEKPSREEGFQKLVLQLPKASIDRLQGDASKHALVPSNFRLLAEFHEFPT